MAQEKRILIDAWIRVDGTVLSNYFSAVAIEAPDDEVDVTGFGSRYREIGKGLKDATITGTVFNADGDADSLNDVLWPLSESDDVFLVEVRASDDPVSDENPQWNMMSRLFNFSPISGSVGEASTTDVSFRNAAQAGVTRSS